MMKPVWYGVYERIARVNGLTGHGRRVLRRQMRSEFRDNLRTARAALAPFAGKRMTSVTPEQIKEALIAAFAPPEQVELNITFADGKILHVSASGAVEMLELAGRDG